MGGGHRPWGQPATPSSCRKGGSGRDPQTLSPVMPPNRPSPCPVLQPVGDYPCAPALPLGWVVTLDIPPTP